MVDTANWGHEMSWESRCLERISYECATYSKTLDARSRIKYGTSFTSMTIKRSFPRTRESMSRTDNRKPL